MNEPYKIKYLKNSIKPTFIWDNGMEMFETEQIAWNIIGDYNHQYLQITIFNSYINDIDFSFIYREKENLLGIQGNSFYVKNIKEANKYVLSFIKMNDIDLSETIFITPSIEKRMLRDSKIQRLK